MDKFQTKIMITCSHVPAKKFAENVGKSNIRVYEQIKHITHINRKKFRGKYSALSNTFSNKSINVVSTCIYGR